MTVEKITARLATCAFRLHWHVATGYGLLDSVAELFASAPGPNADSLA